MKFTTTVPKYYGYYWAKERMQEYPDACLPPEPVFLYPNRDVGQLLHPKPQTADRYLWGDKIEFPRE